MGRKPKVKDGKVVSLRLPSAFLRKKPVNIELGDWLRQIIFDSNVIVETNSNLTAKHKEAIAYFYKFFNELFTTGKLDEYLDREGLLENAALFEEVVLQ